MNELSLFTGSGGGILGTYLLGWKHRGYVEWDDYCQRVIRQRIDDGILDEAPIYGDIRTFISEGYAASYTGMVDVVTAGFPCQPFSIEGKQRGETDERNMWPETADVIRIVHPRFVLLENVPGIRRYLPVVIRDLRRFGYAVKRPAIVSAGSAGALHIRKRIWIYADAERNGRVRERDRISTTTGPWMQTWAEFEGLVQNVLRSCIPSRSGNGIHDAVAYRMDRLRATGNGQVPGVVQAAWEILSF